MAAAGTFRDDLSFHFVFRIVDPVVLLRQPFRHIFTANLHYCTSGFSQRVFLYFNFQELNNRYFLKADYSMELDGTDDRWRRFLPFVVSVGILLTMGLPLYIGWVLFHYREELDTPKVRSVYGFLYLRFNQGREMWEVHEIVRKSMLCGALVYLPGVTQAAVTSVLCLLAVASLNYFQPHRNRFVFFVCECAFISTALKYLSVLIMMSTSERHSVTERDKELVGVLLISLDLLVMLVSAAATFAIVVDMKRDLANQIDRKVSNKEKSTHVVPLQGGAGSVVTQRKTTQQASMGRLNFAITMRALEKQRQTDEVEKIHENSRKHRTRARKLIARSQTNHSHRTQARLAARAKVKRARALEKCQQFASLDADSISTIVDAMVLEEVSDGTIICEENAAADKLFILTDGACEVTVKRLAVARLTGFSVFGESSLFGGEGAKRNATVIANGRVRLLSLEAAKWKQLVQSGVLGDEFVVAMRALQDDRAKCNEEKEEK